MNINYGKNKNNNNNNNINNKKEFLTSSLKKILFDEQNLNELKKTIDNFVSKNSNEKELKEKIVNYLISAYNQLLGLFPVFHQFAINNKILEHYGEGTSVDSSKIQALENELLEKNKFLEEVRVIIDRICNNIQE